jgi:hypothetical protein
VNRGMRSKRPAKACADSSVGMMPSVRASNCAAFGLPLIHLEQGLLIFTAMS